MPTRPACALVLVAAAALACGGASTDAGAPSSPAPPPAASPPQGSLPAETPPPSSPPPSSGEPSALPAPPVEAGVQLGGAGDEWARAVAACPDGSAIVASASGPPREDSLDESWYFVVDPHDQPNVGVARVSPAGRITWTREATATGDGVRVLVNGVACAEEGVLLALEVQRGALDLGGGPVRGGAIVALGADGRFLRQLDVDGAPRSVAFHRDGGFVVAAAAPPSTGDLPAQATVTRRSRQVLLVLGPDGAELARSPLATCPGEEGGDAWWAGVAFTPHGDVWVVGDARRPLDAGFGPAEPRARDVFLVRRSP